MPATTAPRTARSENRRSILIIDDDEVIREILEAALRSRLPDADVSAYDIERLGRPPADFDWSAYDLLLLDYHLGEGETGVDWLQRFSAVPGFPPTLLITGETSATVVGEAVHNGAVGYMNKSALDPDNLARTVGEILDAAPPRASREEAPPGGPGRAGTTAAPDAAGENAFDTGADGGNYRFIRLIGRGAMSRVYLAERSEDRTTVVLKLLARDLANDPENVQRFAREGELIARIDSPYVVKVFDHGTTNSYGYIAMEFFGRGDLAQRMEQGVSADDAVLYLHNIACALDAIHRHGIVHRDLKPANIMFRGDGSMALADFGLSKQVGMDLGLTATGVILGTPYCMSPEQTEGLEADHRSDLYGAGVMFYEMLTGERPFTAANLPALLMAIQKAPVPRLPRPLERYQAVVDRLLAKDPARRYRSANELIDGLQTLVRAA